MKKNYVVLLLLILLIWANSISYSNGHSEISGIKIVYSEALITPVFTGTPDNSLIIFKVFADEAGSSRFLNKLEISFSSLSDVKSISAITLFCGVDGSPVELLPGIGLRLKGRKTSDLSRPFRFVHGENRIIVKVSIKENAELSGKLQIENVNFVLDDNSVMQAAISGKPEFRFAKILRAKGQDGVDTYRIPGLITTSAGTLIAVYDIRYNNSKDLQEDIDIGMSRSTDDGQTWEPMKVIMDMGEYGGRPREVNGVGDPCVLYDPNSRTIWVAGLWMSGSGPDKMLWWSSGPGMEPEETGQILLVKSTDDGLTWSQPINITPQIKNPLWQLLLQGPGKGITMKNGTIVFPAQFKADIGEKAIDGGQYTCHSTIVYSKDGGLSWNIGTGAKSNTTESQVVELSDGSLMINMRDDRNRHDTYFNNGRAVAVSHDLGATWKVHSSSNSALPEPNCMASLIAADVPLNGVVKRVLIFSNPASREKRNNMTLRASLDEGKTWPSEYQVKLNQADGFGYSCLTMVDDTTIGILYEGVKELFFQKIPVKDLLKIK